MTAAAAVPFRFDAAAHRYIDLATGVELPHITGMLERTGWIDDTWFTEESCERGTMVHRLTADYDLGALDPERCVSGFRPYLLAHVKVMQMVRPEFLAIEEPAVHPTLHFGGRPDRIVRAYGLAATWEIKSGPASGKPPRAAVSSGAARSHQIQTALQAILVAPELGLPADALARFCEYVKPTGRLKVEQHRDARDFAEAYRIIRACCA